MSEKEKLSGAQYVIIGASIITALTLLLVLPLFVYYFPEFFIPEGINIGIVEGVKIGVVKDHDKWGGGATRNLLFAIGGLLGFLGLCLGAWRTIDFSKQVIIGQEQVKTGQKQVKTGQEQVKVGQEQVKIGQEQVKTGQKQVKVGQEQAKLAREQQFSEALSRAIDSLGKEDSLTHKNAGLYLFESLATPLKKDSDERKLIVNMLHGFIRERAILPEADEAKEQLSPPETPAERADIVTALEVIFRIVPAENRDTIPLTTLDFKQFNFPKDLERVEIEDSNLEGANLIGANLEDAHLRKNNLEAAILANVNLEGAYLWDINLENAYLWEANLKGAELPFTNVKNVNFRNTDISDADLNYIENLTQGQLDECVFEEGHSPKNLPKDKNGDDLKNPKDGHYTWEEDDGGELRRKFKVSGEWIDTFTPSWKKVKKEG